MSLRRVSTNLYEFITAITVSTQKYLLLLDKCDNLRFVRNENVTKGFVILTLS